MNSHLYIEFYTYNHRIAVGKITLTVVDWALYIALKDAAIENRDRHMGLCRGH